MGCGVSKRVGHEDLGAPVRSDPAHEVDDDAPEIPLAVRVQEVAAVQQAMAKLQLAVNAAEAQLAMLEDIGACSTFTDFGLKNHESAMCAVQKNLNQARASLDKLRGRYLPLREGVICLFTPLLTQSVDVSNSRFGPTSGEVTTLAALSEIEQLCVDGLSEGVTLRQEISPGTRSDSIECLYVLLAKADRAQAPLKSIAERLAAVGGSGNKVHAGPLKGVPRCLQKAQEDYDGDYSRLIDLARVTVIFSDLAGLAKGLRWLLSEEAASGLGAEGASFTAKRIKDRMSFGWNSELSGGNRDVMVNGVVRWWRGGRPCSMLVEIQLHLRSLFDLKHDLHTLYSGVRVLGVADDEVALHQGQLTNDAILNASRGVVRKLHCNYSSVSQAEGQADALAALLQASPCFLMELKLAGPKGVVAPKDNQLAGRALSSLLLSPADGRLTCTRLCVLVLARRGLTGSIPKALCTCPSLRTIGLNGNALEGHIPPELSRLMQLKWLHLDGNKLSGPIPPELALCPRLKGAHLHANNLSGEVPMDKLQHIPTLKEIKLHGNPSLIVTDEIQRWLDKLGGASSRVTSL